MRIIQIAESLSVGDAVANDVVAIDTLLKQMGVCGGIYITNAGNINKRYLHKIAEPIDKLPEMDEDDLLLFHHAIANDFCYQLPKLSCRKVLIYHNITPPSFFEGLHEGFRDATQRGLDQLMELTQTFDYCIADSEFNKQDLIAMGYQCPIHVCPVLIPLEDYRKTPTQEIIDKYSDGRKNFLFVGRLSPNKKQEDIIHAFAVYKKYYDSDARLFLVGSDGVEAYGKALREYVARLGVEDVIITGSVPFPDILAYYSVADVFVCMSEHEGFCVPLIEAMFFDVPVLAFDSCAIPYTLEESGVLLRKKDFPLAAGWMYRMATDQSLREDILEGQKKRLEDFSYEKVATQTKILLESMIKEITLQTSLEDTGVVQVKGMKSDNSKSFVLIMPIKASDWKSARKSIPLIKKNLKPSKIILISSSELKKDLPKDKDILFIDEGRMIPGMTLSKVKKVLEKAGGNPQCAWWYLQQFLKLGFSRICPDSYYLVWDADTLPLNPISFFDEETGKPYLNLKREYVAPYFNTLKTLLGLEKCCPESFITEHMLFDTKLCQEMLLEFENNSKVLGETFWEKCIFASDFSQWEQSFSEYETFGTYVMSKHPGEYQTRKLRTFRCGTDFLGDTPSADSLDWVAQDFDTISFEHWSTPIAQSLQLIENKNIRENLTFGKVINYICDWAKIQACIGGPEQKEFYHRLCLKMEFDYFFGEQTVYERDHLKT